MPTPADPVTIHATTVAMSGRGVAIVGAAGSGKSSLALHMMALGAVLVSDDRTVLHKEGARIMADAPDALRGLIEARGVGVLNAEAAGPVPVTLVIDLDQDETQRLPQPHSYTLLGVDLPCLHKCDTAAWPAAIRQYLRAGAADL
ncbi:HPr kinase/phosphorylase [Pseudosulfitobacter koreensis]|uniref:HPr kinase/phosphatase C-terminal domain-containing protein n=1 Tax=Pseudosulfitobacter koreensis TaxID=2968472 RepID=A0ABT1YVM8_9RHOB|nr:HPr kinase/phosphatase C-terminal domain-containing protein [Pseudosulfitobacter koreense]MCR8824930.1 HPr kinase/phosphatase C-terminal domain-containing protein [Pseudosulfitobacter koreense]